MKEEVDGGGSAGVTYPGLSAPGFGSVLVDSEAWERDLYIRADGKVRKRDKAVARAAYGTSHGIGPAELKQVCKGGPQTLVIAAGYGGVAKLRKEGRAWLEKKGITCEVLPTPDAVQRYNELSGPRAILVHVTC